MDKILVKMAKLVQYAAFLSEDDFPSNVIIQFRIFKTKRVSGDTL